MKNFPTLLALVVTIGLFLFSSEPTSATDIPHLINYQGMLADDGGNPLTGTYDIHFKIYNAPSGGALRWQEFQADVPVNAGLFSVILGSVDPIVLDFSEDYWLDVTVEGEQMPSRVRFTSQGYAYRAQSADTATISLATESYPHDHDADYVNVNGPDSVRGNTGAFIPVLRVMNYGLGNGIYIYAPRSGLGDGLDIDSAGDNGIQITDVGDDGIYMNGIHDNGIDMSNVEGDGIHIADVGHSGIYIRSPLSYNGVSVRAIETGVNIDTVLTGIWVDNASDALLVESADFYGLWIKDSGHDGIYVQRSDQEGIEAHGHWGGGEFYSDSNYYYAVRAHSKDGLSTNPGLYVFGTSYSTGGWGKSVPGSSGDVSAFSVCSPDVELIVSGTGTLVGGKAQITFDPKFQEAVSSEIPVKVILTAQGAPSGLLYVESKSNQGFAVKRLEIPDLAVKVEDATFDWIAIGRQKGYERSPEMMTEEEEGLGVDRLASEARRKAEELRHQKKFEQKALLDQQMLEKRAQREALRREREEEHQGGSRR